MVHKKCKKWRSNYKQHFFRSFSTSQRSKNQTRMWRADELVTELSSKLMTAHFSPASVFVFIRAINSEQMHSQFLGAQDSRSLNALFVFLLSLPYLFTQNSGTPLQVHFFIPSILTHDERREKFSLGIDGGEKWAASGESAVGFFEFVDTPRLSRFLPLDDFLSPFGIIFFSLGSEFFPSKNLRRQVFAAAERT